MECIKCHLIYKKENIKIFTCNHNICDACIANTIIKELINNIDDIDKTYSINCKCNKGILSFNLNEIKNLKIPLNFEEKKICSKHVGEKLTYYDKTIKTLLCDKCFESDDYSDHEKIQIAEMKSNIKQKVEDIKFKTYDDFKKYLKEYLEQFIKSCNMHYQKEIEKIEILVEKIKNYELNLKKQMETQIQKETILFDLIDKIYENNYKNLKYFIEENDKENICGYRFYKNFSKIKFNFGEFNTEHQEEIIPEIDNIINEFDKNIVTKKFRTNIKYPYFELIKQFTQINDIKQESIISCLAENKNSNELFIGYRDYSINILHPKNYGFETVQTLKSHKGEITSLLYIDEFLVSGSKDRTIKIWQKDKENMYKLKQIIKQDKEIKRFNRYVKDSHIGFLATGEENNFRLFLKKENKENKKEDIIEEEGKKDEALIETDENKCDNNFVNENIFKIEQVLSDHDNEVVEAIQIKNNNDIISGSKDMTIIIWKDLMESLQYECNQIISAGNEVEALCPYGNKGFAFALNVSYDIKIYELNFSSMKYENIGILNPEFSHDRVINQLILLKDNRIASCSYDSTVKIISYNSLTKELREDQVLDEQNLSVNGIIETKNGKLITGGHGKHLIIYKRN